MKVKPWINKTQKVGLRLEYGRAYALTKCYFQYSVHTWIRHAQCFRLKESTCIYGTTYDGYMKNPSFDSLVWGLLRLAPIITFKECNMNVNKYDEQIEVRVVTRRRYEKHERITCMLLTEVSRIWLCRYGRYRAHFISRMQCSHTWTRGTGLVFCSCFCLVYFPPSQHAGQVEKGDPMDQGHCQQGTSSKKEL